MNYQDYKLKEEMLNSKLRDARSLVRSFEVALNENEQLYCENAPFKKGDKVHYEPKFPDKRDKAGDYFIVHVRPLGENIFMYTCYPAKKDGSMSHIGMKRIEDKYCTLTKIN